MMSIRLASAGRSSAATSARRSRLASGKAIGGCQHRPAFRVTLTSVRIRPVQPGEGPRLRELRLRALADAPDAFGATLAGDEARPPEFWEGQDVVIAERDGAWLGMAGHFVDPDLPAIAQVWG